MSQTPIIALRGVSKAFGPPGHTTPVLVNVDFEVFAGEKVSLMGASGSGKSTLLSLIAGLLRPDAGRVEVDGVAMSELDEPDRARLRAERVGIALQADNLIPFLNARENVELALAFGVRPSGRDARTRALGLLERFGVVDRAEHRPRHLSGGEAQRVALAVSMANEPALLLADEVVTQLDSHTARRVVDDVLDADFALLYVSHDVGLADRVASRYSLNRCGVHSR